MELANARTLSQLIGSNLRAHRDRAGWSQDHVASILRSHGLRWGRSTLAKIERGERSVSIEELLVLSLALDVRPAYFLNGSSEWIALTDELRVRSHGLIAVLEGSELPSDFALVTVESDRWRPARIDRRRWRGLDEQTYRDAERAAWGDAEMKSMSKLRAQPIDIALAAFTLWGHGLTDERERRIAEIARDTADERALSALRGHVTRELIEEIEPVLAKKRRKR